MKAIYPGPFFNKDIQDMILFLLIYAFLLNHSDFDPLENFYRWDSTITAQYPFIFTSTGPQNSTWNAAPDGKGKPVKAWGGGGEMDWKENIVLEQLTLCQKERGGTHCTDSSLHKWGWFHPSPCVWSCVRPVPHHASEAEPNTSFSLHCRAGW